MDTIIQEDFAEFVDKEDLFNSDVLMYVSKGGSLVFEGRGTYDEKPNLVENENDQLSYQGHRSILTLLMSQLSFMNNVYFSLKGYYVEITDNKGQKAYTIENSPYNSNVNAIYCELKES